MSRERTWKNAALAFPTSHTSKAIGGFGFHASLETQVFPQVTLYILNSSY